MNILGCTRGSHRFLIMAFLLCVLPAFGQDVLHPMIGGFTVSCVDATGAPVFVRFVQQFNDAAASTIIPMTGERLIVVDYPVASHFPQLLQLFMYAHECGHHISGDIVAGIYFREVNPFREQRADRIGIRLLRDEFHITQSQADAIANTFYKNPPIPGYLPGPQRAKWISDCYKTNNDNCSLSQGVVKPEHPDADADANADATDTDASSCVDVDYTYENDMVSWNKDPDTPTVTFRKRFENTCDKPVHCKIKFVVGIEQRQDPKDNLDWQETDSRTFSVTVRANGTRMIYGTLQWQTNRPPSMMPAIRYSHSRDDDYPMNCTYASNQ